MSDPITQPSWLPPYFGPWDRFIDWLLHNPTGGSGHGHPHLVAAMRRFGPDPDPWTPVSGPRPEPWMRGVTVLLEAIGALITAGAMPQGPARDALQRQSESVIAEVIDDFCGTPPHPGQGPFPGPRPGWQEVVSALTLVASTLPNAQFRDMAVQTAGRMAEKALSAPGAGR